MNIVFVCSTAQSQAPGVFGKRFEEDTRRRFPAGSFASVASNYGASKNGAADSAAIFNRFDTPMQVGKVAESDEKKVHIKIQQKSLLRGKSE